MNAKQKAQLHKITNKTLLKNSKIKEINMSLEVLKDIPVTVSVGMGKQHMLIKDLLALKEGDYIPLDKKIGDSLDIYVNNQLIGYGELVISEDKYAVSITSLIGE